MLAAFEAWLSRVRELGVEVTQVSIPDAPDALAAYMTLTSVASLDWLEPYVASELAGEGWSAATTTAWTCASAAGTPSRQPRSCSDG